MLWFHMGTEQPKAMVPTTSAQTQLPSQSNVASGSVGLVGTQRKPLLPLSALGTQHSPAAMSLPS